MSESNGNGRHGLIGRISDILISALPPAFLLLVIINIIFLGFVVWFINNNAEQRNALLTEIVRKCLLQQGKLE